MLISDLDALAKDRLDAFKWILAQISLVQTNTINRVLTVNPITVITKFMPEDIIFFFYDDFHYIYTKTPILFFLVSFFCSVCINFSIAPTFW